MSRDSQLQEKNQGKIFSPRHLLDKRQNGIVQKLKQLPVVGKCVVLAESPATVRAYLKKNGEASGLARAISDIATGEHWRIEELHTEEGRLDEVFRNITRPETKQEEAA